MANFPNNFLLSSSDDFPLTERELSQIVCDPTLDETIKFAFTGLPATRGIQSKQSRDFEVVASISLFIPTLHFV
jgi:hypothetical protein